MIDFDFKSTLRSMRLPGEKHDGVNTYIPHSDRFLSLTNMHEILLGILQLEGDNGRQKLVKSSIRKIFDQQKPNTEPLTTSVSTMRRFETISYFHIITTTDSNEKITILTAFADSAGNIGVTIPNRKDSLYFSFGKFTQKQIFQEIIRYLVN